jgi:ferritin-like protein
MDINFIEIFPGITSISAIVESEALAMRRYTDLRAFSTGRSASRSRWCVDVLRKEILPESVHSD